MNRTIKDALINIIHCCRKAKHLAEVVHTEFSYTTNIFDDIAGELEDALYIINQEKTDTLQESVVDQLICTDTLSDEEVAETLYKLILSKHENEDFAVLNEA